MMTLRVVSDTGSAARTRIDIAASQRKTTDDDGPSARTRAMNREPSRLAHIRFIRTVTRQTGDCRCRNRVVHHGRFIRTSAERPTRSCAIVARTSVHPRLRGSGAAMPHEPVDAGCRRSPARSGQTFTASSVSRAVHPRMRKLLDGRSVWLSRKHTVGQGTRAPSSDKTRGGNGW